MTKPHSTTKTAKTKTTDKTLRELSQRHYTVGYAPQGIKPNPAPQLTIKGKWLELLGFAIGQPVTITAKKGKLIVELAKQIA